MPALRAVNMSLAHFEPGALATIVDVELGLARRCRDTHHTLRTGLDARGGCSISFDDDVVRPARDRHDPVTSIEMVPASGTVSVFTLDNHDFPAIPIMVVTAGTAHMRNMRSTRRPRHDDPTRTFQVVAAARSVMMSANHDVSRAVVVVIAGGTADMPVVDVYNVHRRVGLIVIHREAALTARQQTDAA
jgi:hypothetical protein